MIESEKACFGTRMMCRALGVSSSGYYAWASRGPSPRALENVALGAEVEAIHQESRATYGSPRVHEELRDRGKRVSRKRVARLMRERELRARTRRRFRRTTDSSHSDPIAPNVLDRRFIADAPDQCWVGDITYLWTGEGWLYLAVLLDLYSRRVIGWSMSDSLHTELALGALKMAFGHREAQDVLHHSDRGCQYASNDYRQQLENHGLLSSMSRRGNCWDNAVAESFFSTLKLELVYRSSWTTRAEARADVHEYIEVFYNRRRKHSTIGYKTPVQAEQEHAAREEALNERNDL